MKGKWLLAIALAALAGAGVGGWSILRQNRTAAREAARKPAETPAAPPAEVSLTGPIAARNTVAVAAPIDGLIDAVFVEVGQEVMEGQLLARIRSARNDAALEAATADMEQARNKVTNLEASIIASRLEASRAEADATRAKADYDRAQKVYERQQLLMKEGATPRLVYEKAQRDFQTAQQDADSKQAILKQAQDRLDAQNQQFESAKRILDERNLALDQAKADVSAGELVSPAAGIVAARKGNPGDEISPTVTDFFRIATDAGALDVAVEPPPPELARIRAGQAARVRIAEFPDDLPATVREVKGGTVYVDFTSPSPVIKPGASAQVRIQIR